MKPQRVRGDDLANPWIVPTITWKDPEVRLAAMEAGQAKRLREGSRVTRIIRRQVAALEAV